jgi:hypothetical protein
MMTPISAYTGKWVNLAAERAGVCSAAAMTFRVRSMRAVEMGSNYYSITYVPEHGNDGNFHNIKVKVDRPGLTLLYRPGYGAEDTAKIAADSGIQTMLDTTTPEPKTNTMVCLMARFAPVATQVLFDVKVASATSAPRPPDAAVMGSRVAAVKDKPMLR